MITDNSFPVGTAVLHPDWPEAHFNVSGMFAHELLVIQLANVVEKDFSCRLPIDSIHGSPPLPWNAGRIMTNRMRPDTLRMLLNMLYEKRIGYFATLTNHLVTEADLDNPAGNELLQIVNERPDLNGIIIVSDILSKYIARKYPAIRQVASVIKTTLEGGIGKVEYYRELEKRFFRYVVDPDDSRNPKLLDQLDRSKAEIMLNENCVANCPNRARHYHLYAKMQRAMGTPEQPAVKQELDRLTAGCHSSLNMSRVGLKERSCNLSRREIKQIYNMGFRHFKLQGRADDPYTYGYDLVRMTLEPEFAAPRIHKLLSRWLCTVVEKVDKKPN